MDLVGVCLDAANPAGAPEPDELGAITWTRFVALDNQAVPRYMARLHLAEFETGLVLARESMGDGIGR